MIRALLLLLLLLLLLSAGSALAQPIDPKVQARADLMFEKAQASYESGQYQAAIELFQQAYALVNDPVYLFNIAQSYRKVLDCENAYDYYNRYLTAAPKAPNKAKVQQWLRELQPCVDERQREREAARRGEEAERARRADELKRRHEAAAAPSSAGPHDIDHGQPLRIAGISLAAAGAIGVAVGVTYSVKGSNLRQQIADACKTQCDWSSPAIHDLDQRGKSANRIATYSYVGGGIAAIAGVGLYLFGRARVEHVTIAPAEGGATVGALLRF